MAKSFGGIPVPPRREDIGAALAKQIHKTKSSYCLRVFFSDEEKRVKELINLANKLSKK